MCEWRKRFFQTEIPCVCPGCRMVPRVCEKAPNGTLQVYFQEAGKESFSMTTLLQCYTGKKGRRYTIWGKHRIYEGYSGPVVLRNVPDGVKNIIQEDAEKYGTIIE